MGQIRTDWFVERSKANFNIFAPWLVPGLPTNRYPHSYDLFEVSFAFFIWFFVVFAVPGIKPNIHICQPRAQSSSNPGIQVTHNSLSENVKSFRKALIHKPHDCCLHPVMHRDQGSDSVVEHTPHRHKPWVWCQAWKEINKITVMLILPSSDLAFKSHCQNPQTLNTMIKRQC